MKYAKAEEVLPAELVEEIRKHCTGMIYVKSDWRFYKERYREVMRLHEQGLSTKDIAQRVHLCTRRVQQIICQQAVREDSPRRIRSVRSQTDTEQLGTSKEWC